MNIQWSTLRVRRALIYLAGFFCLGACIAQLTQILNSYFKFETVFDMQIETFLKDLPSVTIVASTNELLENGYLKQYFENHNSSLSDHDIGQLSQNYSRLGSIIDELEDPVTKVRFSVLITNQYNPQFSLKIDEYSSIYADSKNIYFTFSRELTPEERRYAETNNVKYTIQASLGLFRSLASDNISLCMVVHSTQLSSSLTRACLKLDSVHTTQLYGYWSKTVKLLPHPYTNCTDYTKIQDLDSRATCFDTCLANHSCSSCGYLPEFVPISLENSLCGQSTKSTTCFKKENLFDKCEQECGPVDCSFMSHEVSFERYGEYVEGVTPFVAVGEWVNYPNFEFLSSPKIETIDVIVYVGSTLTMWLGFSLYAFLDNALNAIKVKKEKVQFDHQTYQAMMAEIRRLLRKGTKGAKNFNRCQISVPRLRTVILWTIALFALLAQSYTVVDRYLHYATAVDVYIENFGTHRLPGLTFFFSLPNVFNYTLICQSYPHLCNINKTSDRFKVARKFRNISRTFGELERHLLSPSAIFNQCQVHVKKYQKPIDCFSLSKVRIGFHKDRVLYTFFDLESYKDPDLPFFSVPNKATDIFDVTLDVDNLTYKSRHDIVYLKVHSARMGYAKTKNEAVVLSLQRNEFVIQYRKLIIEKLPAPYKTDCWNYSNIHYRSQGDCYVKCTQNLFFDRCNHTDTTYTIYNMSLPMKQRPRCFARKTPGIIAACNLKCPKDNCKSDYYDDLLTFNPKAEQMSIRILFPQQFPALSYIYRPKNTFFDTLVYLGGILGICFGFSVISCLQSAEESFDDIFASSKVETKLNIAVAREIRRQIEMMEKTRSMSIFRKVVLILAITGATFQTGTVVISHLQYPMVVKTTFEYENETFPAISILDRTEKVSKNSSLKGNAFRDLEFENSYKDIIHRNATTERIYWAGFYYYTMKVVPLIDSPESIFIVRFWVKAHKFALLLHSHHVKPNINPMYAVIVDENSLELYLSYDRILLKTLPAPYATKCEFDGRIGKQRQQCMATCVFHRKQMCENAESEVVGCDNTMGGNIEEVCYYYCEQRDCNSLYYFPTIQRQRKISGFDGTWVNIQRPTGLTAHYTFLPKLSVLDLIIFLGSTLGLWLGLDAVTMFMHGYVRQLLDQTVYKVDDTISAYIAARVRRERMTVEGPSALPLQSLLPMNNNHRQLPEYLRMPLRRVASRRFRTDQVDPYAAALNY